MPCWERESHITQLQVTSQSITKPPFHKAFFYVAPRPLTWKPQADKHLIVLIIFINYPTTVINAVANYKYLSMLLALIWAKNFFPIIAFSHMHCKRFVTRRCKWLGLTWRYWRWWLTKLLLKLLHTWHIWASNRYEAHSSDCKQTEHPQKEQNIELSPEICFCCKLAFKYDFMQKSIFIKNEFLGCFKGAFTLHNIFS